jgi:hypothetical protein
VLSDDGVFPRSTTIIVLLEFEGKAPFLYVDNDVFRPWVHYGCRREDVFI